MKYNLDNCKVNDSYDKIDSKFKPTSAICRLEVL